jgi:hypothetical protein
LSTLDLELVVAERKTVVLSLPVEPRVARPAGKEVLEGLSQLHDRYLGCVLRHLEHPRELLALDRIQLALQCSFVRLGQRRVDLARLVLPSPLGQRPVVGEAGGAGRARQMRRLRVARVEPDAVGNEHGEQQAAKVLIKNETV